MKKFKGILSTVLALALAVLMMVPMIASAAVPSDQLNAMEFKAYRVLDRDQNTIPAGDEDDNNKVYTVNADFVDFFANITPENYQAGIRNGDICITVDDNGYLKIVPSTDEAPTDNVIILPVNKDVTANSAEVLAGVLLNEIESDSAKASDAQILAGWLRNYAESKKEDGSWPTQDPVTVTSDEDGMINIGDLNYGYWLVYSTNTIDGISNVKVVLEVGEKTQETIKVKAEYDGLTKKVRNLTDDDEELGKIAQADASDILEYEVNFNIQPLDEYASNNNIDITELKYIITDTLTNQRLVKYTDTKVAVEGASPYMGVFLLEFVIDRNGTTEHIYYADVESKDINRNLRTSLGLSANADLRALVGIRKEVGGINYGNYENGQQQFSITFEWNDLQTLVGKYGAKVTLKYKAELTSDAILKNPNKVELDYSNNPNDHTKSTHNEDTTTVYSYGLDIKKTFDGVDGDETLWESVIFNLYEASLPAGTEPGNLKKPSDLVEGAKIAFIEKETGTPGDYQRADSLDNGSYDIKLKTTDNSLNLYGLDPGYYILEETGSPNGYLLGGKVYIYIDEKGNVLQADSSKLWLGNNPIDGGIIGTDITYADSDLEQENPLSDSLKIKIDNKKRNFQLPETGDIGVWLFGIGSVVVLAGAAFVYSEIKKRSHN